MSKTDKNCPHCHQPKEYCEGNDLPKPFHEYPGKTSEWECVVDEVRELLQIKEGCGSGLYAARQLHYQLAHEYTENVRQYFQEYPETESIAFKDLPEKYSEKRKRLAGLIDYLEEMYPELKMKEENK